MTTSRTHPAAEVPGGLWNGAPVCSTRDILNGTVCQGEVGLVVHCPTEGDGHIHPLDDGWDMLRLDDPLGLGLAGLTAQVAERLRMSALGPVTSPIALFDTWHDVYRARHGALLDEASAAVPYDGGLVRPWATAQVRWIASRIALTDRLCAAVGLALEPGEVAGWVRCPYLVTTKGWHLKRGPVVVYPGFDCADIDDPLAALRAAVSEVCDG